MATKLNELDQKRIDAKATLRAEERAFDKLADGEATAKASYRSLLKQQAEGRGSDEEKKALATKIAAAEAETEGYPERLKAQRALVASAKEEVSKADEAYQIERDREQAALRVAGETLPQVEVGKDNREDKPWASFGEQLQAVCGAALQPARADVRLKWADFKAAATGLGAQVGSDGGYLVEKSFVSTVLERVYSQGDILSRVFRLPQTVGNGTKIPAIDETSRADGSRWGGVQGYWVAEGTAPTATKPKIRQIELELRKVAALVYATDELLADAAQMEALVMRVLPEELTFKVEDAVVNGTGAGQPLGYTATGAVISVAKEAGQAGSTVVFENVVKMWSRMWGRSRSSAVWLINQDVEPQLFGLSKSVGTGGIPVYLPANGLSGEPFSTLFGRPVLPVEYCATLGTVGDIQLVDLSQYVLIDKGGIKADASMHVRFIQDEMTFRFLYRVDGQPTWNAALTPKNGSNTLSPFVVLATRA